MTALGGLLRRMVGGAPVASTAPGAAPDHIGERLHDAVAAELRATANNVQTYDARVQAMIEDFFAQLGELDANHRP